LFTGISFSNKSIAKASNNKVNPLPLRAQGIACVSILPLLYFTLGTLACK